MVYQRVQKFSLGSPSNKEKSSQFFAVQSQYGSQRSSTQQEIENEIFNQNKFEAFGLQLKDKSDTITPIEQQRSGVLKAKMDDFWTQRLESASRFEHNFANIPGQQVSLPVQPRLAIQRYRAAPPLQSAIASQLVADRTIQTKSNKTSDLLAASVSLKPNKTGLPDALKAGVETLSGYSLDNVRVHFNSPKPAQLQALAYTQGTNIHVAPGQEEHLPHEAWHAVQQADGRVKPTIQLKNGVPVNDDEALEREADVMGKKALQMRHNDKIVMHSPASIAHGTESLSLPIQEKIVRDLMPETRLVSSALPSDRSDRVVQRRPLDEAEQERLEIAGKTLKKEEDEYTRDKTEIQKIFQSLKKYGANNEHLSNMQYLHNRMEHKLPELDKFFQESNSLAANASNSVSALRKLENNLKWYQQSSDGKDVIKLTVKDLSARGVGSISVKRDDLGQITGLDEKFFEEYLQAPKPPVTVYRGDGRGVNAKFLDNFAVQDVLAGGTRDISFYGVVQHTHSSTCKNGMVSTTTNRDQAYKWAMDDHNYGVVYEFRLTHYIDVADLLKTRNFKNRFDEQMEILVPGNIDASDFVSVSLYGKEEGFIKKITV